MKHRDDDPTEQRRGPWSRLRYPSVLDTPHGTIRIDFDGHATHVSSRAGSYRYAPRPRARRDVLVGDGVPDAVVSAGPRSWWFPSRSLRVEVAGSELGWRRFSPGGYRITGGSGRSILEYRRTISGRQKHRFDDHSSLPEATLATACWASGIDRRMLTVIERLIVRLVDAA